MGVARLAPVAQWEIPRPPKRHSSKRRLLATAHWDACHDRFLPCSHNGLVFTSRSYGLRQEFITPHSPEQDGMVERLIRTLKEQCAHRHRCETLQHASRVIGDWIS